jgi:putative transposase
MYDPDIHHRQSLRWRKHDYSSPAFYYVTMCTQDHRCPLGDVDSGVMHLNDVGRMVDAAWLEIPTRFPRMCLDEHITMPNHFHCIIQIVGAPPIGDVGAPLVGAPQVPGQNAAGERGGVGASVVGARQVSGRKPRRERAGVGAPLVSAREASKQKPASTRAGTRPAPTLGDAVGAFKSLTTDEYILGVKELGWPRFPNHFWQRNYYDHVIRDQDELEKIREYIRQNPLVWTCDRYNPENPVLVVNETGLLVPWDES